MYILAIDQGTSGTTALLYDEQGNVVRRSYRELPQIYPRAGWVEHDPEEIWQTAAEAIIEVCADQKGKIAAVGIANQRETTVLWDARDGRPLYNAIVWQCRRTQPLCEKLKAHQAAIRDRTGLPVDPYFSATKARWILDHTERPADQHIRFGTVDTWLVWKLTEGGTHATDFTNASRTLLFNIHSRQWDADQCELLGIPPEILPDVRPSMADYGTVAAIPGLKDVPILGVAGDQQAALFGQTCFAGGQVKNTYGTGAFLLMNTGNRAIDSTHGLLTTLAVDADGLPCYALEGSVFIAGAAIQWLRDEMGLLERAADSETAARSVDDNGGVYLVPAFVGLGAPHWAPNVRACIVGLSRGTNRNHIIRAALEAIAFQTADVLRAMQQETGLKALELAVDGGAAANGFLLQFQADILDCTVIRPTMIESTSTGAAFLAGRQAGIWPDADALLALKSCDRAFVPQMGSQERQALMAGWQHALRQALTD